MRVCDILFFYGGKAAHPKRQSNWWAANFNISTIWAGGPFHLSWSTTTFIGNNNATPKCAVAADQGMAD